MAKCEYQIEKISKKDASTLVLTYHYLKDISKGFKSGVNYGLFYHDVLIGCCVFTGFPVPEVAVGCFGLDRSEQEGLYELSRFVIHPDIQKHEHNISSWFLSRCLKLIRKEHKVRAILSYADDGFHDGIIYQATNFKYYGLTNEKKDFWIKTDSGFKKHSEVLPKVLKVSGDHELVNIDIY